jgi:4-hydroxybenzoate polyprenyltransferase
MLLHGLKALRPHQWVKNLLVLAPLLFFTPIGGQNAEPRLFDAAAWLQGLLAFAAFCLAASGVYVLNDIVDRESDRQHPKKRLRPIASGALPVSAALLLLALAWGGASAIALAVDGGRAAFGTAGQPTAARFGGFAWWPFGYLALNLAYSFWWKRVVVLDCMCIAIGFGIRVKAGAAAIAVDASHWILLCTFFFALFLAFCKRFEELGKTAGSEGATRATLRDYTEPLLGMLIGPLAALLPRGGPIEFEHCEQVLPHRQLAENRSFLREVPEPLARALVHRQRSELDVSQLDRALVGGDEPHHHRERGRLAGSVGPEEADDLTRLDVKADAVDDAPLAVRLAQTRRHQPVAHPGSP